MLAPVEFRMRQKMACLSAHRLADGMAIASAYLFTFLAAYRIQLPGLYCDELAFVNAAQGGADNTFIHMRLGSMPVLIFPYGSFEGLDLRSRLPLFRRLGFDYPLTGYSSRGGHAAHLLSDPSSKAWGCLGHHRRVDNGRRSG